MRRAALLLLLALTAACGSTVQQTSQSRTVGASAATTANGAAPFDEALDAPVGDVAGATAGSGQAASARAAVRPSPGVEGAAGRRGGTVRVGVRYPANSSGLLTTAGFSGVDPGDSKAMAQAVIDDVNGRGGIAGRRVEPVYFPFDVTGSTAPGGSDNESQKACAAFTEDTKVFAVVSPIVSGEILQSCLSSRGVVFVDENWNYIDAYTAGYWTPAYADTVRSVGVLVDRLVANGFLNRGAKIGAVYQDLKNRARVVNQALEPALDRHGLKIDEAVAWTADNSQQLAAGVLKFRAAGITHVFVLDPGGLETFAWMTEAEAQGFRPKYAIDTRNYPFLQAGQAPPGQLVNARGIGWLPAADLGVPPPGELSAADRRCLSTVAKAGQDMGDATNVRVAFAYCDTLEFLKAAAGDSAVELSMASVQRGGEALGTHFTPTGTFAVQFGPGRHDGAAMARDLVYDASCGCFRYSGTPFPLG